MLSPETILQARYRIVRQLGQGGMGAVYEAIDQRLDTVVALKETLFTEERLRKQFEREARLLARLHHQALPRVSHHFSEGDGQFLVMQYVPGDDLSAMLLQRNGPFPQEEVLRWADQLCDALDYLHTQDPEIIHRDIKPQNLNSTARGQVVLMREAVRVASVSTRELGDAETVLAPGAGGYSGASTVASGKATRLMGEQTQAAGNEARTLLAANATKVRGTSVSEVATVVRS